jgi:hypothetical protein
VADSAPSRLAELRGVEFCEADIDGALVHDDRDRLVALDADDPGGERFGHGRQ